MEQISGRTRTNGQALVTFVFFILVLVFFLGIVIDIGFAYVTRASLSKAVDAASLSGVRNLSQGPDRARVIATSAFKANYGRPGRDVADVNPSINFTNDANNNLFVNIDATATINTFFIRIFPQWKTLSVQAHAQAIRPRLVLGLVLDISESMNANGGAQALPGAVGEFIDDFIENHDRASMSSFNYNAKLEVPMMTSFTTPIKIAANSLSSKCTGWTASEQGLTNGWAQVRNVVLESSQEVVRAVVFFTDGLANTWQYNFVCGAVTNTLNIAPESDLYDPNTGERRKGCVVPPTIPSIVPPDMVDMVTPCPDQVAWKKGFYIEAQKRAENIARQIRAEGIYVYAIGMADPTKGPECGYAPLNIPFLRQVANEDGVADPHQPQGIVAIATAGELSRAFDEIARKILMRLTI